MIQEDFDYEEGDLNDQKYDHDGSKFPLRREQAAKTTQEWRTFLASNEAAMFDWDLAKCVLRSGINQLKINQASNNQSAFVRGSWLSIADGCEPLAIELEALWALSEKRRAAYSFLSAELESGFRGR